MAAPDLTQKMTVFVQKEGTDDVGANFPGRPYSRLTIDRALLDLADTSRYPAASSTYFHIVAIGPGTFVLDQLPPPWTFFNGSCDGEGQPTTILLVSADLTLPTSWNTAAARGGLANVTIQVAIGTPALDCTLPVPLAGNPIRVWEMFNVHHNLPTERFEATSTADVWVRELCRQFGTSADTLTQVGGTSRFNNNWSAAKLTIVDKASFAAVGNWDGVIISSATSSVTANSIALAGTTLRLTNSSVRSLVISETAPGTVAVSADTASLPVRSAVTYTGLASDTNLTWLSDAAGVGYTPTTPANWPAGTNTVQKALDALGSGSAGHDGNGTLAATNNAGNTTITPAKATWTQQMMFTGAAGTRIMILDVATPPIAGDTIDLFISKTDGGGIVVTVRNATAGGTLLATFGDGTGVTTARGQFVYGTIATGYAANAWVAQAFQIPATT